MEKNEFQTYESAVIKHMKDLMRKEIKPSWIMFITHLYQRLRLYTIGWMNLNVVVHPYVMHLVRDVQLRLLRQKSSIKKEKKSMILFWLIEWKCVSLLRSQAHYMMISILHEQLDMKKLLARWVPRLLTISRVMISKQCLEMFQRNPD